MKFIKTFGVSLSLMAGFVCAQAQGLGVGTVINPYPPTELQTFLQAVTVVYDFQKIRLINPNPDVKVTFGGETYTAFVQAVADPEIAWDYGQTFEEGDGWGNTLVIDFSEEVIDANYPLGEYIIEIPADIVENEDGVTNASHVIEFFRVDAMKPVSVTPPDGLLPKSELTDIRIEFDDEISFTGNQDPIVIRKMNDWLSDPLLFRDYKIENGNTLCFDLSNVLPQGYEYMIEVVEGFLRVGEYGINAQVWLYYTSWDGLAQPKVISAPEPISSQSTLKPLILSWNQPIQFTADAPDTELVIGFPDYGIGDGDRIFIPYNYYSLVNIDANGNVVDFDPAPANANALYLDLAEFTEEFPGYQFEINLPVGLIENMENQQNASWTYTFTMKEMWLKPIFTTEPDMIYVEWPDCELITINLDSEDITLKGDNGYSKMLGFTFGHTVEGQVSIENEGVHRLEIDLSNLDLTNGNYIMTIPQGYVLLDAQDDDFIINGEVVYEFEYNNGNITAGIKEVSKDMQKSGIYDIHGRKINENVEVKTLPKGIYIINGKKVFIP